MLANLTKNKKPLKKLDLDYPEFDKNDPSVNLNKKRIHQLDQSIDDLFGHLALDEIDILEHGYIESTTRMITVIKIGKKGSHVMDLKEDIEFKAVLFPETLLCLLRRNDVFFTTMGFREGKWHVLFLSPLYRTKPI